MARFVSIATEIDRSTAVGSLLRVADLGKLRPAIEAESG
jgi:hypothetical protein